jgi:hypothetical protein
MEGAVTLTRPLRPPRTLWQRCARLLPAVHWELHILQAGLAQFAARRPWVGVPAVAFTLALLWGAYWVMLPVVLLLCLVTRVLHPVERRLRRER